MLDLQHLLISFIVLYCFILKSLNDPSLKRDKKKVLLLGPAHPFRGGIADTQNCLAQNLNRLGHETHVYTFTTQYPKLLFPGKTQFSKENAPDNLDIKRKIHTLGFAKQHQC